MDCWLNVGIEGGACWPEKETEVEFGGHKLILKPATKDTDQSIHINLKGINDIEAMTLINRFLSILSWCDDDGIINYGGGYGPPVPVSVPRKSRMIGSSIAFPFYRELSNNPKVKLALALYREGRTNNSIPVSFLIYFKIVNIFWNDRTDMKTGKNELVEGIRKNLHNVADTLALERIKELEKIQVDIPNYLYKDGRCAIAHAYKEPFVDPDESPDLYRLSADLAIIKSLAEYLIEHKLGVSKSIIK